MADDIDTTITNEGDDAFVDTEELDGDVPEDTPKEEGELEKLQKSNKTKDRKYAKLVDRNKELEKQAAKNRPADKLTEDEKKEKDAEKFLNEKVDKRLEEKEEAKKEKDEEALQQFSDELDDVLEENTTLTEKEVLDLIEEFAEDKIKLSPRQAANRLLRKDDKPKEKPKMPVSKRGSGEVKNEPTKEELDEEKGLSFQEKLMLRKKRFLAKNQD